MTTKYELNQLIAKGKIGEAITCLSDLKGIFQEVDYQELVLFISQYNKIMYDRNKGILSFEDYELRINKVIYSLIVIIWELELEYFPKSIIPDKSFTEKLDFKNTKELLGLGELIKAIGLVIKFIHGHYNYFKDLGGSFFLISARIYFLEKDILAEVISKEEQSLRRARIVHSLLDLLELLKNDLKKIEGFHYALSKIRSVKTDKRIILDISNCGLKAIPNEVFELKQLEELTYGNIIFEFKNNIQKVDKNFGPNTLDQIPTKLLELKNLKGLYLGGLEYYFSEKDENVLSKLINLEVLNLRQIKLTNINFINNLSALKDLDLGFSGIKNISPIQNIPRIKRLFLDNNQISDISYLSKLENIQSLILSNNQIKDLTPIKKLISEEIDITIKIKENAIVIDNNPLEKPSLDIVREGKNAILDYFDQLEKTKDIEYGEVEQINRIVKLILVGNSSSGKTSMAKYLKFNNTVDENNTVSTHWLENTTWDYPREITLKNGDKIDNLIVRLFDFGGQEYYHDSHHFLFSNNSVYLLIWEKSTNNYGQTHRDIRYSFDETKKVELQHYPVTYWLDAIEYYSKEKHTNELYNIEPDTSKRSVIEAPVLIIQNKIDLDGRVYLNNQKIKNNYKQVYDFTALSLNKISPRTKHLRDLIHEMLSQMNIVGLELPVTWAILKQYIEKRKDTKIISFRTLLNDCNNELRKKRFNEKVYLTERSLQTLCIYLRNIGSILYYQFQVNSPTSEQKTGKKVKEDLIVLDISWFTEIIRKVFKDINRESAGGQVSKKRILKLLTEYDAGNLHGIIIEIMLGFNLIIELYIEDTDEVIFIAPQYLPAKANQVMQMIKGSFNKIGRRLAFEGYIHRSIVLKFFSVFHKNLFHDTRRLGNNTAVNYYFWKNGLVLNDKHSNDLVLIEFINKNDSDIENENNSVIFNAHPEKDYNSFIQISRLYNQKSNILTLENNVIDHLKIHLNNVFKGQFDELVTINGIDFIPIKFLEKQAKNENFHFIYNERSYSLYDFKEYVRINKSLKVFISYSSKDISFLNELEIHLSTLKRSGYVETWSGNRLLAGEKWHKKIQKEIQEASLIIFLISPDFLASDYIMEKEVVPSLKRSKRDGTLIIPIIVRPCVWKYSDIENVQMTNKARPISIHNDKDQAWVNTIDQIVDAYNELNNIG